MRSKAPPPMGARGAMQFRRDGAKRSSRTGAAELSEERARRGGGWEKTRPWIFVVGSPRIMLKRPPAPFGPVRC